jgi:hypothetical protein
MRWYDMNVAITDTARNLLEKALRESNFNTPGLRLTFDGFG